MKYTSAEANKLLRQLNDDYNALLAKEDSVKEFVAAVGEDIEGVRPEYDYEAVQAQLDDYEEKIRKVKHAINVFNTTHIVSGFDMTIDAMLVYIPQLNRRRSKLIMMKSALPKQREAFNHGSNIIDYRYANYDIEKAEADYKAVSDLLSRAQLALDMVNSTETMEIDI